MKRASRVAVVVMGLLLAVQTAALLAGEPEKKNEGVKPPWQRLLRSYNAKKVAEQEKKLAQLQEAGQFEEALKVAQALVELRSKVQGIDHWEAVNARFQVEVIRRALLLKKREQRSFSKSFVIKREAEALRDTGRYREAQPLFEQVLSIWREVLGEQHPDMADSHNNLANNLQDQGKHKEAEEQFRLALSICRKVLGEEHPHTATTYNNLALNLQAQGKYKEADEDFRKALSVSSNVLGEEHPDTAITHNNLAMNLRAQGKYREAEEAFGKALSICRKVLGEEHANTAVCYANLASSLRAQGKYKEADEGFRKASSIFRSALGEEHPSTATSYNELALNLLDQGKYKEAEEALQKALSIDRKMLGAEHPDTATSYGNLSMSLNAQGKYKEAEEGIRKALAVRRKLLGEEHPDIAGTYSNLAVNLYFQGRYKEAEENSRKALAIESEVLGEQHPLLAASHNSLALNLQVQGKYKEAEESLRKALAINRKVLGQEHPQMAASYNNLARNFNAEGKYKEAEQYWLRSANVFARARLQIAAIGLERATKTSEQSPLPSLAAVLARNGKPDEAWQRFEEGLSRGTWDDLSARIRRPQAERGKQIQITARIDRLNQLINAINTAKSTEHQSKQRDELLSQLRQACDELSAFDRELEKKYGPIAGEVFSRDRIQTSLSEDTALLAWLDIPGQPKAADPNGEHWAILLRSSGHPVWLRLYGSGEKSAWTEEDTQLPARLRAALQNERGVWQPLAERLRKQRLDPLAKQLKGVRLLIVLPSRALAGVPVEVIADNYTVSYAHSGTMYAHLRQPAPIGKGLFVLADPVFDPPSIAPKPQPLPPGGVLITFVVSGSKAADAGLKRNDVLLRYGDTVLSGPEDFKPQPESNDPKKRVPVVVWREGKTLSRPLFVRPGKLGVAIAQDPAPQAVAEQRRIDRLLASRNGDEGKWDRLPGSRIEAASLHRLFDKEAPVKLLLDSDASEQRLNELARSGDLGKYRYIHLATHGEVNDTFSLRSAVILSCDLLPDDKQRTELLVSGQPIPDGRLDAEEALQRWNLQSDLVTLSACETALGKYERGEGFVGFAQSLILCGTRSVCLSLWKVSDTATALLMERFYQNLLGKRDGLKGPLPKAAALAEAKEWLRNLSREEAVKHAASLSNGVARGKRKELPPLEVAATAKPVAAVKDDRPFAHPYYWAAFVLVGHAD